MTTDLEQHEAQVRSKLAVLSVVARRAFGLAIVCRLTPVMRHWLDRHDLSHQSTKWSRIVDGLWLDLQADDSPARADELANELLGIVNAADWDGDAYEIAENAVVSLVYVLRAWRDGDVDALFSVARRAMDSADSVQQGTVRAVSASGPSDLLAVEALRQIAELQLAGSGDFDRLRGAAMDGAWVPVR